MVSVTEAQGQQSALQAAMKQGLESIDRNQTVTFTQYTKSIISSDGSVFWVATGNQMMVDGSLHVATDRHQDEDQTIGLNRVIFTAESEVSAFDSINPSILWVGSQPSDDPAAPLEVVFSRRSNYYEQADVWHYVGDAVYPALKTQLIASAGDLPAGPIVSNSLPLWLAQNSLAPVYPSYLVPDNVAPPYVVAHVEPEGTEAIQPVAAFLWPTGGALMDENGNDIFDSFFEPIIVGAGNSSSLQELTFSQLMKDRVILTLYGFSNQMALQYWSQLQDYSVNTNDWGLCNSPAIRDEKRTQVEISAIAQKKTLEILASYYQSAADAVARRLILKALATVYPTL